MRIVYIEDESADAQLVERYANLMNHALVVTDSIHLILVDMSIHQSRIGYDFVREIRTQGFTKPIVAVTGLTLAPDVERCYEVGCDEVLTKPYTINQLAELFSRYEVQSNRA